MSDADEPGLAFDLRAQTSANDVAELGDAGVGDGVVGGGAHGAALDDAGREEDAEVLADVRLGGAEALDKLANVKLAFVEQRPEDREPGGIAEHAEAFSDVFEELWRKVFGHKDNSMTSQ